MTTNNNSLPTWLLEVKEDVTNANEWIDLTKNIYQAVDQHLQQSHMQYFTDLSDAEKMLLLERSARSIAASDGGTVYDSLQSKLSYILDQSVNNQVAKKLLEESPSETKTDLILDTTCDGIISLLRKHPDQKFKLHLFLNQAIPQPLRFLAWQLFFSNTKIRKEFITKLANDPKSCISPIDTEIQRKSASLISNGLNFKDLRDSEGALNSIKGILSYYHTTLKKGSSLTEAEYLIVIPFITAHFPFLPKNEKPTERQLATLVEMFLQFTATLPTGINEAIFGSVKDANEMESLVKSVIVQLDTFDTELLDFLKSLAAKTSPPGIEDITFLTAAKAICTPLMKVIFSGYLNMDALLFVWDQYVISSDVPEYHDTLIPIVCAIILMILRDQLMACKSFGDIDECIRHQATFIQARQLQNLINRYYFKLLQKKLNSKNPLGPMIDPTAGRLQPWEHWHLDKIPNRPRPAKRDEPREDNTAQLKEYEDKLRAEVNKRIQMERAMQDEISRLRREMDDLRKRPKTPPKTQRQQSPTNLTNKQPIPDLFKKLFDSMNKITNGEDTNQIVLNDETREILKLHKLDLKIAEKQTFGRMLRKNEWNSFTQHDKNVKSEEMLEIVKSRIQKRYAERGKY